MSGTWCGNISLRAINVNQVYRVEQDGPARWTRQRPCGRRRCIVNPFSMASPPCVGKEEAIRASKTNESSLGPGKAWRKGMTLFDLMDRFPNDAAAERWLVRVRWPAVFAAHAAAVRTYMIRRIGTCRTGAETAGVTSRSGSVPQCSHRRSGTGSGWSPSS